MSELYPFLLSPCFDRRPWGTRNLAPIYDRQVEAGEEPIGEAWLTSEHSRVTNGPLAESELGDLCRRYGRDLVGTACPNEDRFPLLMKFLFPREKLSVQVHPDDETAHRQGQPCGKTECWYVLHSEPGAQIGLGLKPGVGRDEFERAIQENKAEYLLNWINVQPGEMYYVEAGTVHALGGGSIILETQQNSDTTYRLYDYGRGRELHVKQGLDAIKERTNAALVPPSANGSRLIEKPFFVVDKFSLQDAREFVGDGNSAQVLVAIDGSGKLEWAGAQSVTIRRCDTVVIPASMRSFRVTSQSGLEFVNVRVPAV